MKDLTYVGIAEYKIISREGILACSALGSCVGICLWDRKTKLAGLLHVLLPSIRENIAKTSHAKFADSGIEELVRKMEDRGAERKDLRAKLVGGACLYHYERFTAAAEIGDRNIEASRKTLKLLQIPIVGEHVGGEYGRSIKFNAQDFTIKIKILSQGETII